MAHRIYIYNINPKTGENFPHYLGEWNYEIPPLLLPLFGVNMRSKGSQIYADKEQGISNLRRFYDLLGESYQLSYKKAFYEPVNTMFSFLESLPYDTFQIDGTDVFNMNEEKHSVQAKDWVIQIKEHAQLFEKSIEQVSLSPLQEYLSTFGYASFLEALQTDWINYGLGYWNDEAYKNDYVEIFTENDLQGLKDAKGNTIVLAIYEDICAFVDNIAVVQKNKKYGYINSKGNLLVPAIYDDAFDLIDIFYGNIVDYDFEYRTKVGIIALNGQYGLIDVQHNNIIIPIQYQELEHLSGNFFNARIDNQYSLIDHQNKTIITEKSNAEFQNEGYHLLFTKINGSSKRRYFARKGIFLGEYVEDVIENITHDHFYVKPNKWQKKIEIISPDGTILDNSIDQIISLDIYDVIAYKKNSEWYIYNLKDQKLCSINTKISDVIVDYFSSYYPNVFILKTSIGIGLYDAGQDIWLIPCKTSYKEIYYLYEDIFRIKTDDGYRYWNHQSIRLSEIYDYISEPINSDTQKLLLYKNKQLFALTIPGEIFKIQNEEIGKLYQNRYNLRGKDSQYFNDYYENWKFQLGADYYHYYDDNSLYHFATDLVKQGNIRDALPLLQLGTNREHPRMMTELGIIYAEQENTEFYNIDEAFKLYTKAADLDDEWALNNLGTFYQAGLACKQDINKAIALYAKAAKLGNGLGWSNLADLYYYGELVEQDYDKAEQYYLMAQKLYHYNEDKLTEIYYSKGDFKKVIPLLKKDYEEIFSPIYYGILYENGYGLKTNLKKAILYYEKALTIAPYAHAVQRLLFHYQKCSPIANEPRFNQLLEYAREHEIEINQQEIGLETPKKDSFFKKLFKK